MWRVLVAIVFVVSGSSSAYAQHHHHAKHGFILFGDRELYGSHKVCKEPHNFQVILDLTWARDLKRKLEATRAVFPDNLFLFVLDEMDLSSIASMPELTGTLVREDRNGGRFPVFPGIRVGRREFQILYQNELPLSLGGDQKTSGERCFSNADCPQGQLCHGPWIRTPGVCR